MYPKGYQNFFSLGKKNIFERFSNLFLTKGQILSTEES